MGNDNVNLAPTAETANYFDYEISDGTIILTAKSDINAQQLWEIVVSPPVSYVDESGTFYITLIIPSSFNPNQYYYDSDNNSIGALSVNVTYIDSLFHPSNQIIYELPDSLSYIQFGGLGGDGTLPVGTTIFMSVFFVPAGGLVDSSDIISVIQKGFNDIWNGEQIIKNQILASQSAIQSTISSMYAIDDEASSLLSAFFDSELQSEVTNMMGVMTFGDYAITEVLSLFSPEQELSSELIFPSMSLNIGFQRTSVQLWPEYNFDLEVLSEHFPFLINLMRTVTVASVWIMVIRYCYITFEKYFMAGDS